MKYKWKGKKNDCHVLEVSVFLSLASTWHRDWSLEKGGEFQRSLHPAKMMRKSHLVATVLWKIEHLDKLLVLKGMGCFSWFLNWFISCTGEEKNDSDKYKNDVEYTEQYDMWLVCTCSGTILINTYPEVCIAKGKWFFSLKRYGVNVHTNDSGKWILLSSLSNQ